MTTGRAIYEDQAFLVIVCQYGDPVIVASQGEMAKWFKFDDTWILDDIPESRGLHFWGGRCETLRSASGSLEEADFTGCWRPALLHDFVRFGLPVPLPRLPDGVLA